MTKIGSKITYRALAVCFSLMAIALVSIVLFKSPKPAYREFKLSSDEKNLFSLSDEDPPTIQKFKELEGLLSFESKPIEYPSLESSDWQAKDGGPLKNFTDGMQILSIDSETYTVSSNPENQAYSIKKDGKEIFSSPMCFGANGPVSEARLINDSFSFTFLEGPCEKAKSNIFYKGGTINALPGIEASHFLFSYKNKLGFVGKSNGQEYIYFNNRKISKPFDLITTTGCCGTPRYFKVYENGALLFLGQRGADYYLTELSLNKFLP
jgi:hypothetical protein